MNLGDLINNQFYEFALIIFLATIAGAIGRVLRQPLIVSFIAVGILVGPSVLNILNSEHEIDLLAEMGIAILLFVVGLKLDINLIKSTGKVALMTGLGQVIFTSVFGFGIAMALGFDWLESVYVAVALTFSSTIIIVKLLSDKKEIDMLHGQIALGFLIVQDIVVVIVMIVLSALGTESDRSVGLDLLYVFGKGIAMFAVVAVLMKYVIPKLTKQLADSQELLVLFSIGWAILLAAMGDFLGFSKEVGAFLAGISLASTQYREVISGRLTSVRDFLLLFFFLDLGSQLNLGLMGEQILPSVIFSVFVLVGNPIIVLIIMGIMGYHKRTSFKAGLTVAQISEFSLILINMGMDVGHIDEETLGLVTLVGLITITLSTYMIMFSDQLFDWLSPMLGIFEKKKPTQAKELEDDTEKVDVLIFGLGRYGKRIARALEERDLKYIGADIDPALVNNWKEHDLNAVYCDAEDPDLGEVLPVKRVSNVISTISDVKVNIALMKLLRHENFDGRIAVTANNDDTVQILKEAGAEYILEPYKDSAKKVAEMFSHKVEKDEREEEQQEKYNEEGKSREEDDAA
ncbi:cation:proton antiporter [Pontibacter lucknowensis]|uniref:Transporter, CPA2 family n=1 Tax=Pontibacter lucknowensis TaxID=1077936 RepID=A0A1N6UFJ5_9BACT|nr:cation:proton antiporter [Pontibacter lucknowensis]SIQ64086.1 transporter, CPA2 family [Pontibacter lucknowensis]